jgi:hypothetical protein
MYYMIVRARRLQSGTERKTNLDRRLHMFLHLHTDFLGDL